MFLKGCQDLKKSYLLIKISMLIATDCIESGVYRTNSFTYFKHTKYVQVYCSGKSKWSVSKCLYSGMNNMIIPMNTAPA